MGNLFFSFFLFLFRMVSSYFWNDYTYVLLGVISGCIFLFLTCFFSRFWNDCRLLHVMECVCVCVFFTLNRSSTRRHPAHPVSVLILHPRKISSVVPSVEGWLIDST